MSQDNNQILASIEDFISTRALLLITKVQVEGRHQACMELDDKCAPEFLQAMCVSKPEGLFRKMRAAHSTNNKTGIAFTESYAHKCRREGIVYKALLGLFEFKDMPQDQPCALKIWSYANENQVDIVQLWRDTLDQVGGNAKVAKKTHVIDAFTLGNLQNQVTDLQTQLQTQAQQTEEQVALLVAARLTEERERMEADFQRRISNHENDVLGRINQLSDDIIQAEEKQREAERKKKEADEKLAAKMKEAERLTKELEDEKTRSALAIANPELFGTQERRDSTASDTTLVDPTRGTKRSLTADESADLEKLNKRLKIAEECLDKIGNNTYLAYYKLMGTESLEQVSDYDELCNLFKENKTLSDENQSPKYEIKIHHDEKSGGIVMKDIDNWKRLAWRHFKKLVGRIQNSLEKKKESYSDLEFEEAVDDIITEGGEGS